MAFPIKVAQEIWVSVTVYGPQTDIDRFRAACLIRSAPGSDDDEQETVEYIKVTPDIASSRYGAKFDYDEPIYNFREKNISSGQYYFAFDVPHRFLTVMFENHAAAFPSLAIFCECIASADEFMGIGWFNIPEGGEPFDFCEVPEAYWGHDKDHEPDPIAEAQHLLFLEEIACAAADVLSGRY